MKQEALRSFVRFAVASVVAFASNIGLTALFHELLGLPPEAAFGITIFLVLVLNFTLMRYYVTAPGDIPIRRQFLLFVVSSLSLRVLDYLAFILVHTILGIHYLTALIGVLSVSFFVKFVYYRLVIFTGRAPVGKHEKAGTDRGRDELDELSTEASES